MQHAAEETALATVEQTAIEAPVNPANPTAGMYCSMKAGTREEKLAIFKAISDPEPLEDHIGERLDVEHIMIQPVELPDPITGELKTNNRFTLITVDGQAYNTTSKGVDIVMQNLFAVMGTPPWVGGIPLVAHKEQGSNKYKYTTLRLWED